VILTPILVVPPMTRATRLILRGLANGPLHGYGIISWIESTSGSPKRIAVATMYSALDRLQREGLVEVDREETMQGRVRRYFRLTESGRASLLAELTGLETELEAAKGRLSSFGSAGGQASTA